MEHEDELKRLFTDGALPIFMTVLFVLEYLTLAIFCNEKYRLKEKLSEFGAGRKTIEYAKMGLKRVLEPMVKHSREHRIKFAFALGLFISLPIILLLFFNANVDTIQFGEC